MDIILCHITADFDTLGAAIGLTRLYPGSKIVLGGGAHPAVQEFLALHRDEYALIERRSVRAEQIRRIFVVDTQQRSRLGRPAEWLDLPDVELVVYDHHLGAETDLEPDERRIEPVGAATTLVVEQLQAAQIAISPVEATAMALGIHVDTGSLTFDHSTARDAAALTWLMQQGVSLSAIGTYAEPALAAGLRDLLPLALKNLQTETVRGCELAWVLLTLDAYLPGLSSLTARLFDLIEADVLLLAARYLARDKPDAKPDPAGETRLTVIGRARGPETRQIHLGQLLQPWGGDGHARAAAVTLRPAVLGLEPEALIQTLVEQLKRQIPQPLTAREIMSSPVRTIRPETTIAEAQRILLRYGHSGLSVVEAEGRLVGIISRRDLDIALNHGFSHAPVKGYMATNLKTIAPDTSLPEIESLMITFGIGRLPVLEAGQLVGIVTRTDVLRERHQAALNARSSPQPSRLCPLPEVMQTLLQNRLAPPLWELLCQITAIAEQRGWQLYLVGGAVRDLLRNPTGRLEQGNLEQGNLGQSNLGEARAKDRGEQGGLLKDIDLVVDGYHSALTAGDSGRAAGVEIAKAVQQLYPKARLQVHGRFQTAALSWHHDPQLQSLGLDIATARTEFYPYPAANPEVEASSIRQDLYRRDFTINALAVRLTAPRRGELLDFFGGLLDLQAQQIRVLHANSFIEDPTRIYRAVRFAVRLGFEIEPQTESYIRHAIASGVYRQPREAVPALQSRLRQELRYILGAPYWRPALQQLESLGAIVCIHPDLDLSQAWPTLGRVDRWLRFSHTLKNIGQHQLEHWLTMLEVILLHLNLDSRTTVAQTLQLPADSLSRLQNFDQSRQTIQTTLPTCHLPSQIVELLDQYDLPTLILVAAVLPRPLRRQIWRYLTHWSQIKAPLDGQDLQQMGYKPGRQFKQILDALRQATLDDVVNDVDTAKQFVKERFPGSG
ncbi:MAG: CBS domain-containing protein [Elainella sp.]